MAKREMRKREDDVAGVENEVVVNEAIIEEKKVDVIGTVVANGYKKLNIRKSPKTSSDVVTTVDVGSKVTVVDVEKATGDWYKVRIDNGTSGHNGYCMKEYIKLD